MQRYFLARDQFTDTSVQITGDDAHHIMNVMRSSTGEQLICSNGVDREVLVQITELQKGLVHASIVEELSMDHEPGVEVWIAQSLPKGDKMESVIQKCTEIGAARFIPFVSERTIVQYDGRKELKRIERWQKIAKEAAEQAHRNRMPAVEAALSFKQLLDRVQEVDLALFCYEKEAGLLLKDVLQKTEIKPQEGKKPIYLLIIGSEGGFTEGEMGKAEAAGCKSTSLGSRILRTETAAMVGLTCIMYETGEMG
ncbi:MAG TPA: 16S rRNA (uracil(1498)-N(3))-methyltransferase [Bacilli bacterium]